MELLDTTSKAKRLDAFISYSSYNADIAEHLQHSLEQFGKPLFKRKAMDVFRDESRLGLTSELWPSIQRQLDQSERLILLVSQESKESIWVNREVEHWLATAEDALERMILVVVNGEPAWSDTANDFERAADSPIPKALFGVYLSQPMHIDLRWLEGVKSEDFPDLNSRTYRSAVVRIVAATRELSPEDVESDALHQLTKTKRYRFGAVAAVLILGVLSSAMAILARESSSRAAQEEVRADEQTVRADEEAEGAIAQELLRESARLASQDPALALILAAEATKYVPANDNRVLGALTSARQALDRSGNPLGIQIHTDQLPVQLAFSPDDTTLSALMEDGSIGLWDGRTALPLEASIPSNPEAEAIAYTSDGLTVIGRGIDSLTVEIWEIGSSVEPQSSHRIDGSYLRIEVSPDGSSLAAVDGSGEVSVFDLPTGTPTTSFRLTEPNLDSAQPIMTFSPDGETLGVFSSRVNEYYEEVYLWDRATGLNVAAYPSGIGLYSMNLTAGTESLLAGVLSNSGGRGGGIGRWTLESAAEGDLSPFGFTEIELLSVDEIASSPDGSVIATGTGGGELQLWTRLNLEPVGEALRAHTGWFSDIVFNHQGNVIASAGADNTIQLWRRGVPSEELLLPNHPEAYQIALGDQTQLLATGSTDGSVKVWSVNSLLKAPINLAEMDGSAIGSLAFNNTNSILAVGTFENLFLAEPSTGKITRSMNIEGSGYITALEFGADDSLLVTGSDDGGIRWWDTATGSLSAEHFGGDADVGTIDISADGNRMAALYVDGAVAVWDLSSGSATPQFTRDLSGSHALTNLAISSDGSVLFGSEQAGGLYRFELAEDSLGEAVAIGRSSETFDLELVEGLGVVATIEGNGTVRAWDILEGREVTSPIVPIERPIEEGVFGVFIALEVSGDGTTVLAATDSNSIHIWHSWSVEQACEVALGYVPMPRVLEVMEPIGITPSVCFEAEP